MIEVKEEFSQLERMLFGPLFGLFCVLVAAFIFRHFQLANLAVGVLIACSIVIAVYYLKPTWQVRIFRAWLFSFAPLGWIISHLVLVVVYYFLVTPIGGVMRLIGYDPLQREIDPSVETYWIPRHQQRSEQDYFRQF